MGILITDLFKEQNTKPKYKFFIVVILSFIVFFYCFNFWIFPFLPSIFDRFLIGFNYSIYALVTLVVLIKSIKLLKQKEQEKIGVIIIKNNCIITQIKGEERKIYLIDQKIRFYYDENSRFRSSDGYSELQVGDEKFHFKISRKNEIEELKSVFKIWYHSKFNFLEAKRGVDKSRLVLMNLDFDWKKLQEIKKNIK